MKTVITAESCECITAEGDILRKVHPEWLETVIPKIHPQIIMVVKGQQKGQVSACGLSVKIAVYHHSFHVFISHKLTLCGEQSNGICTLA